MVNGHGHYLKLGIPKNILPEIIDTGTITGKITTKLAGELGIGAVPVVAVAEHDTGNAVVSVGKHGKVCVSQQRDMVAAGSGIAAPVINDDLCPGLY